MTKKKYFPKIVDVLKAQNIIISRVEFHDRLEIMTDRCTYSFE